MKKKSKKQETNNLSKLWKYSFIAICVLLCLYLMSYILIFSKSLLNSDSTFIVDYAQEIINHKSLFPKTWYNTNDFWIYSLIPLIVIFIKMGFSLINARQLSVLLQTVFMFIIIYDLYKTLLKDNHGWKILFILLLTGISGQICFELFGDATYGSIIFWMIFIIWLFIKYLKKGKAIYLILLGIIMALLTACSLRFPIYIGAPLICCLLFLLYEEKFDKKYIWLLCTIIFSIMIGYLINKHLCNTLLLTSHIDRNLLASTSELITNLMDIIYNYFWLCGSTNINVFSLTVYYINDFITTSSPFIVFVFIRVIYAIITILLPLFLVFKIKKLSIEEKVIYIFVTSLTLIMIFFLVFGGMSYWYRYITPVLVFLNFLYPLIYKCYINNLKKKIVFISTIALFSISSLFFVFSSTYDFSQKAFRKNAYDGLTKVLLENDLHFGFTHNGTEHNLFYTLTDGDLRITRITDDGRAPFYWLNSTEWFNKNYYDGKIFFMRKKILNPIDEVENQAIDVIEYEDYYIFVLKDIDVILDRFE